MKWCSGVVLGLMIFSQAAMATEWFEGCWEGTGFLRDAKTSAPWTVCSIKMCGSLSEFEMAYTYDRTCKNTNYNFSSNVTLLHEHQYIYSSGSKIGYWMAELLNMESFLRTAGGSDRKVAVQLKPTWDAGVLSFVQVDSYYDSYSYSYKPSESWTGNLVRTNP